MRQIKPDRKKLSEAAADLFVEIGRASITESGVFSVALSGGSTPRSLYSVLATSFRDKLAWDDVRFFFGDERDVPPDSSESNYRMASETLLRPLSIDQDHVYPWAAGSLPGDRAASEYAMRLRQHFQTPVPRFDLILLGLGADGHTASLFPGTEAIHEKERSAVYNWVPKLQQHRLTLTFPVINNAANVMFLVSGADKADAVKAVLEGEFVPERLPAQMVKPVAGRLHWLLDESAAENLDQV